MKTPPGTTVVGNRERDVRDRAGRRRGEGGIVGALRQAGGDGGLAGAFPRDARLRVGALRDVDQLAQLVGLPEHRSTPGLMRARIPDSAAE